VRGVIYVAFGERARTEVRESMKTLRAYHDLPIAVVGERPVKGAAYIPFDNPGNGARRAKLSVTEAAPQSWTQILYLDADTRIRGNIEAGFHPLEDGWDMSITPSIKQAREVFWHLASEETHRTYLELNNPFPIQLQGGVWWVNRESTRELFAEWRKQWERWGGPDQGALLRALQKKPISIWLMGRTFNDGGLVEHRYGCAVDGRG